MQNCRRSEVSLLDTDKLHGGIPAGDPKRKE